jgi:asparagine synthase (glutamine-hydrolysing)
MCGIAGFSWSDPRLIKKMTSLIAHRGPNDSGHFVSSKVSLGNRRLSVIDLSKRGKQPIFNEDRSVVIVFNGEIYNYRALRKDLEEKGHIFKSDTDTETVVHGYEEYGPDICKMLDGMFAFAIWDNKKSQLMLARDAIGKRPLYYSFDGNNLIFGSEIKALLAHPIKKKINTSCLSDYLTLRFSPDTITMFEGIHKIPAGSYAILKSGKLTISPYYNLPSFKTRYSQDVTKADTLISEAVKKRLVADVPVGVFLSGGLDSSAIVAYMSKMTSNVRTFSVGFSSKVDERRYARLIAKKFKTKHTEIIVDKDMLKYLPAVIYHFDEPLADPAALPTYLLCKEVSKHVKVALSGEGGDEVFGGYQSFNYIPELRMIYTIPYFLRKFLVKPLCTFVSLFYSYPKKHMLRAVAELSGKKNILSGFKELFYFAFNAEERKVLLKDAKKDDAFDLVKSENNDLEKIALNFYFREWLPNDLLMKADKMGLAHGLELRCPFLDTNLIEYFSGLPYDAKHKRKLFRTAISPLLPREIIKRKKQGFTLPLFEWFSDKKTIARIIPFFDKLKRRNLFNNRYIEYLVENPQEFKNEHKLWVLLNFEIWYEIYMEGIPYTKIRL